MKNYANCKIMGSRIFPCHVSILYQPVSRCIMGIDFAISTVHLPFLRWRWGCRRLRTHLHLLRAAGKCCGYCRTGILNCHFPSRGAACPSEKKTRQWVLHLCLCLFMCVLFMSFFCIFSRNSLSVSSSVYRFCLIISLFFFIIIFGCCM